MALVTYDLNTGGEGTALSTSNSGASVVAVGTGGTAVFAAAAAATGAYGARLTNGANSDCVIRFPFAAAATNNQISFSVMVRAPSAGTTNNAIILPRHAAGFVCFFYLTSAGAIEFWRTSTAFEATVLAAGSVVANTYYRITCVINSTTGAYSIKIYSGPTSTTALNTVSGTASAFASTSAFASIQLQAGGVSTVKTVDFDNLVINDGSSAEIVPGANVLPSLTLGANQNVVAGASVTATATATDSDGSIASVAWSVVSASSTATPTLSGASTTTVSLTAPAAGNLVTLQCVATDNSGGTATATTEVRVPLTGSTQARPLALAGTGAAWTNTGGATNDGAALADALDTTWLESPAVTTTESARRVRLQPMNARSNLTLTERLQTDTGTANTTIRLYEGTTVRQSWTQAITTTATDYTLTASSTNVAAVGDWGALYVEVGATS